MADKNTNSLVDALKRSRMKEAEKLLELGVDPNSLVEDNTVTPMHLAAGLGLEAVSLMLQHGGDPNVCIQDGTTPLHVAAIWGNSDSVQILLANGGDPFLKDHDGMSAMDLADQYEHACVKQVLKYYMAMLAKKDDQTITPKYTYKRRSLMRDVSPSTDPDCEDSVNVSVYDESAIDSYLQQFTQRRRSSMFLRSIQHQVDEYFGQGQRTHLVDVTSPDHPYVESRDSLDLSSQPLEETENSLNLQLSLSEDEHSTSCDSFITCDGEDLDMVLKDADSKTELESPRSPTCANTVIKNLKYFKTTSPTYTANTSCSSESTLTENTAQERPSIQNSVRTRGDKYCKRGPLFGVAVDSSRNDLQSNKCDYCGCIGNIAPGKDETVCKTCEKLGLELDEIMDEADQSSLDICSPSLALPDLVQNGAKTNKRTSSVTCNYITVGKSHSGSRQMTSPDVLSELSRRLSQTNLDTKTNSRHNMDKNSSYVTESRILQSTDTSDPVLGLSINSDNANTGFCKQDTNDSLISDFSVLDKPSTTIKKAEFHPSDISTITISDDSLDEGGVLDQAYCQGVSQLTNQKEEKGDYFTKAQTTRKHGFQEKKAENKHHSNYNTNAVNRHIGKDKTATDVDRFDPGNSASPEVNDLWSEVRASSIQRKRLRQRDLDTAFVGRDSVGSVLSDASTVEYVYTDTENNIVLIEKHIPSRCGSSGSRRSLDSLFSLNINDNIVSPSSAQDLNNSQDTILYDWQDVAMIQKSLNSIEDSSPDKENSPNQAVSQDILNLDNKTLRTKLVDLGDDPGPVTKTTRQAYLRRLSQLQADPDAKLLTKKGPEFPPELSAALRGTLDLSDMPEMETKMVAAFQNPNRQRRWREGTLKSSFNYILLDPRITRELPNRSANMTDLEVFQTFIYATFYIGKGKRARPYSHLYEAIREMKKASGKASQKIDRILEIWSGDQGVVSLHCFQSVIPVEAYTREACMVDAMGLSHLTNKKRGDYYGVSTTYSMKQRRKIGVYLLGKALQIFLAEGERQIAPLDIKNDV